MSAARLSKRCDEFLLAICPGLAVEGLEVVLDSMGGQFQAPCDLLDGMSLDEETQYVELGGVNPYHAARAGTS